MKKFLVAIMAFLYISTSTGAIVQMHNCMGKLANSGLGLYNKSCGQCGIEKPGQKNNECCKDEHKFFKSQTDQEAPVYVFHLQQPVVALPNSFIEMSSADIFTIPAEILTSNISPLNSSVAVYIRNCVFLL